MEITETLLQYDTYEKNTGFATAVIVAAGSSSRMGGSSKQLMDLGGIPVLARTMLAFERAKTVNNIIVVARECDILSFQMLSQKYMISKLSDIVIGGNCREESVKNGVENIKDTSVVLVHDGARPFISPQIIDAVSNAVLEYGAAACAVKSVDTLKVVKDEFINTTLNREEIYRMQTPQGFLLEKFKTALSSKSDLSSYTDDCAVMESVGCKIRIIEGDATNIKITSPDDIPLAEALLNRGGNEQ